MSTDIEEFFDYESEKEAVDSPNDQAVDHNVQTQEGRDNLSNENSAGGSTPVPNDPEFESDPDPTLKAEVFPFRLSYDVDKFPLYPGDYANPNNLRVYRMSEEHVNDPTKVTAHVNQWVDRLLRQAKRKGQNSYMLEDWL